MKKAKKEFILKAHRDACEEYKRGIEKHWPELFPKEEFKVGDWVVSLDSSINYECGEVCRVSLVLNGMIACDGKPQHFSNQKRFKFFKKATKEEIEAHLIAEAKKRGFVKGAKYKCVTNGSTQEVHSVNLPSVKFTYYRLDDHLTDGCGGAVYARGQWAEIIDQTPKDLQDLITKYGKEKIKEWL